MRILECIALRLKLVIPILELAEECFQSSFDLISHNKSIEQTTPMPRVRGGVAGENVWIQGDGTFLFNNDHCSIFQIVALDFIHADFRDIKLPSAIFFLLSRNFSLHYQR